MSVPVWPITLSGRLLIIGLVGHYPTNYLMRRRLIHIRQLINRGRLSPERIIQSVYGISARFQTLSRIYGQIIYVLLTRAPLYSFPKELSRSTCMC